MLVTPPVEGAVFLSDVVRVMGPRPGRIVAEVENPFQRPRAPELLRRPAFHAIAERPSDAMTVAEGDDGDL